MKYNLEGIDGNAFSIIAYVKKAMTKEKFTESEISEYVNDAMSSNYSHLVSVSAEMIDKCNDKSNAWLTMTQGKKNVGHIFRVVLEFIDDNGEETSSVVLDYYPKSKDEATKIAKEYSICKGERICVYEYDDSETCTVYNIYNVKECR